MKYKIGHTPDCTLIQMFTVNLRKNKKFQLYAAYMSEVFITYFKATFKINLLIIG